MADEIRVSAESREALLESIRKQLGSKPEGGVLDDVENPSLRELRLKVESLIQSLALARRGIERLEREASTANTADPQKRDTQTSNPGNAPLNLPGVLEDDTVAVPETLARVLSKQPSAAELGASKQTLQILNARVQDTHLSPKGEEVLKALVDVLVQLEKLPKAVTSPGQDKSSEQLPRSAQERLTETLVAAGSNATAESRNLDQELRTIIRTQIEHLKGAELEVRKLIIPAEENPVERLLSFVQTALEKLKQPTTEQEKKFKDFLLRLEKILLPAIKQELPAAQLQQSLQKFLVEMYEDFGLTPLAERFLANPPQQQPGTQLPAPIERSLKQIEAQIKLLLATPEDVLDALLEQPEIPGGQSSGTTVHQPATQKILSTLKPLLQSIAQELDVLPQSASHEALRLIVKDLNEYLKQPQTTPQLRQSLGKFLELLAARSEDATTSLPPRFSAPHGTPPPSIPELTHIEQNIRELLAKISQPDQEEHAARPILPNLTTPVAPEELRGQFAKFLAQLARAKTSTEALELIQESAQVLENLLALPETQADKTVQTLLRTLQDVTRHPQDSSLGAVKDLIKAAVQKYKNAGAEEGMDLQMRQAAAQLSPKNLQMLETMITAQQSMQQLNPLLQAAGDPLLLMFPTFVQGFLAQLQVSVFSRNNPAAEEDLESNRKKSTQDYERLSLSLELPALGPIRVDISRRASEAIISFQTPESDFCQAIAQNLPALEERLQSLGFSRNAMSIHKKEAVTTELMPQSPLSDHLDIA